MSKKPTPLAEILEYAPPYFHQLEVEAFPMMIEGPAHLKDKCGTSGYNRYNLRCGGLEPEGA